jgi:hypothetical protein
MREIYSSQDVTEVGYYKSLLDEAGISSFIRNESAGNPAIAGAMFLPTLCLIEDKDYEEAIRILKSKQVNAPVAGVDWICPSCSEKNPSNFDSCWKCDSLRPGVETIRS